MPFITRPIDYNVKFSEKCVRVYFKGADLVLRNLFFEDINDDCVEIRIAPINDL